MTSRIPRDILRIGIVLAGLALLTVGSALADQFRVKAYLPATNGGAL